MTQSYTFFAPASRGIAPLLAQELRDLGAEEVLTDIAAWIKDRSAPLPSGRERAPDSNLTADE